MAKPVEKRKVPPPVEKTAMEAAFEAVGVKAARRRLHEIADESRDKFFGKGFEARRQYVIEQIAPHAELLFELFKARMNMEVDNLLHMSDLAHKEKLREEQQRQLEAVRKEEQFKYKRAPGSSRGGGGGPFRVPPELRSSPFTVRGPTAEEITAAKTGSLLRMWKLDTIKINGRPLGDCTAGEARAWARENRLMARYVEMVTANLPNDKPIRAYIKLEEGEALWLRAVKEQNDA